MYKKYNSNPRGNEHAGDCVIRAIAKATGKTWETIFVELSLAGFFSGDWGNSNSVWDRYLTDHHFKRYICPNCTTVAEFANSHKDGTYILGTGTHAVTVVDGAYFDSWDSGDEKPISETLELFDEVMTTIQVINPPMYASVLRKI